MQQQYFSIMSHQLIVIFLSLIVSVIGFGDMANNKNNGTTLNHKYRNARTCNEIDYTGYNKRGRCCQRPAHLENVDVFAISLFCNSGKPFDTGYFFDYKINKLQNPMNNFNIKWKNNNKQVPLERELIEAACISACAAKFLNLLNSDGSINDASLRSVFGSMVHPTWRKLFYEGVATCKAPMHRFRHVNVTYVEKNGMRSCPAILMLYSQCIHAYLIGRCPASLALTNQGKNCESELQALGQCTASFNFS